MIAAAATSEICLRSRSGREVVMRSAHGGDMAAVSTMLAGLSPRTVALRYLLPQVRLSAEAARREAARVTATDRRRIVYIALAEARDGPQIIGIAELAQSEGDPAVAEGAIVIADPFQGDGVGRAIVGQLIAAAGGRGIGRVRALTLAGNGAVRRLIISLGRPYTARFSSGEVLYEIGL